MRGKLRKKIILSQMVLVAFAPSLLVNSSWAEGTPEASSSPAPVVEHVVATAPALVPESASDHELATPLAVESTVPHVPSAEDLRTPSFEEREKELLDFKSIKSILNKDALEKEAQKKQVKAKQLEKARIETQIDRHNIPGASEVWGFISELWLVRNAQLLKWDFEKADLGIDVYLKDVLKVLGLYQKNFKLLLVNNPSLPHAILPSKDGESIVLLSLPFMQTMDLTKQEISMLVLENYFRSESGILLKKLSSPELEKVLGKNFYQTDFPKAEIEKALTRYDQLFFHQGYQFQEQFEVTKKMNTILKSYPHYWNAYLTLLRKINDLVKTNALYQHYSKIYPSPEMQRRWLLPVEE